MAELMQVLLSKALLSLVDYSISQAVKFVSYK